MIRIYNTAFDAIVADDSSHRQLISGYRRIFKERYFDLLAKKYDLAFGKGGSTYLKELDIYVGFASPVRCRDMYLIDKANAPK
jgi:hypothetical protein